MVLLCLNITLKYWCIAIKSVIICYIVKLAIDMFLLYYFKVSSINYCQKIKCHLFLFISMYFKAVCRVDATDLV